jgi:hypothetical protein
MTFKQFVSRFQIGVLALGAIFVVLLLVGWPGDGGGLPAGPDTSTPEVSIPAPDTSEPPTTSAPSPDVSIDPDAGGPDTTTG